MSTIYIEKINESTLRVTSDDFGIEQELNEYLSFRPEGYQFMPSYRNKIWDGFARMFDLGRKTLAYGLVEYVYKFAEERGYKVNLIGEMNTGIDVSTEEISAFIDGLNLHTGGKKISLRDYQIDAVVQSIRRGRMIALSPTSSGKSAIIYCYIRFMLERGERILLAVPSTSLVTQMYSDFEDYSSANGWDVAANVHQLYSGKEKSFDKSVLFCTWQSIHAMSKHKTKAVNDFYASWTVYIGDEAHRFASASLMQISNRLVNAKYRLGTTGTLNDAKVSKLNLEGSFGAVYRVITTKQLMDAGQVVKLKIKCLLLDYPEHIKKLLKDVEYQKEMDYITQCKQRNDFIVNLAKATKGNTLILFNFVEKHGKPLFKLLQEKCPDRPLFYISGEVATEERERIRKVLSEHSDAIIAASYSTLSTGVNIPSIENVIFASPGKSKIRNLQSIGRGLRLKEGKTSCNLFDIADNFALKSKLNTTMRHFRERIETYQEEQFEFTVKQIAMSI